MKRESIFKDIARFGILLFALGIPISHVPAQIGIGVAFLGWLGEGAINKKWNLHWHAAFIPLIIYLLWNILSSSLSERPIHSLAAILDNEWPILIMAMIYWMVDDEDFLWNIMIVFFISAGVAALYAVWQVFGGVEYYRHLSLDVMSSGLFRAVGFYSFYLTFSALAMVAFFFSMSFSFEFKKWYFVALSAMSFLAVVGSFARSMWLAFAIGIPVYAFTRSRKVGALLTSLVLLIVVGGVLTVPTLRDRAGSMLDPSQNETRLNLWKTAVKISEENPLLGVGEDNWDLVFDRYRVEGYYDTTVHPHNDYLTVLVSSGLPGLLAFLSIWCVIVFTGIAAARGMQSQTLRAVAWGGVFTLAGFLMGSVFQNYYGTFINCLQWWFVAGVLITSVKLSAPLQNN